MIMMTKELSIEQGNKLIACFANEGQKIDQRSFWITVPGKELHHWVNDRDLKYHSSWDWLMPAVEKIRELGFKFIIGDSMRVTVYNKDYDWRNGSTSDSMIECVWHGCVQFIQWYNSQKQ